MLPALPGVKHQTQGKCQSLRGMTYIHQGTYVSVAPPSKSALRGKVRSKLGSPYPQVSHPSSGRFGTAALFQSSICRGEHLPWAFLPGSWRCLVGCTGTPLGKAWQPWAKTETAFLGQGHSQANQCLSWRYFINTTATGSISLESGNVLKHILRKLSYNELGRTWGKGQFLIGVAWDTDHSYFYVFSL